MPNEDRIRLLARVARTAAAKSATADDRPPSSILSLAAASYGSRPSEDATVPTGFDPLAVVLFEAIVEGSFLVANADGVFDDDERRAFKSVVVAACGGAVSERQISALMSDLADQLAEDGADRRIDAVTTVVTKSEHAQEVLRIAALLAQASGDVSPVERETLEKLASAWKLDPGAVDAALADVSAAMAAAREAS
jgi:tellurite resistance protein